MNGLVRWTAWVAGMVCVAAGCQSQRRFASPEEAKAALVSAVESGDKSEVRAIFGPRTADLRSGDEQQDAQDIASFRRQLAEACEVDASQGGVAVLIVGEERWPFAVPLIHEDRGWRFDTDAGIEEIHTRRVGRNELRTIAACRTVIDAQAQYRLADRDGDGVQEYADRLASSPGRKDGLYWPSPGGVDPSPIGPAMAAAATRSDEEGDRLPFHGYFYRALPRQGAGAPGGAMEYAGPQGFTDGWAVIAWPAEYGESGVMSFLFGHGGTVYEKDLGPDTEAAAAATKEFDPSQGWSPVSP